MVENRADYKLWVFNGKDWEDYHSSFLTRKTAVCWKDLAEAFTDPLVDSKINRKAPSILIPSLVENSLRAV